MRTRTSRNGKTGQASAVKRMATATKPRSSRRKTSSSFSELEQVQKQADLILLTARLEAARLLRRARAPGKTLSRDLAQLPSDASGDANAFARATLSHGPGSRMVGGALDHLIGTWSKEDLEEFEANIEDLEIVDETLWR